MAAIFNSFLLVFVSEFGDKTQLLSLVLLARFKRPWVIFAGIFIATLGNHALAAAAGQFLANHLFHDATKWVLALIFLFFAVWLLIPDKEGEVRTNSHLGIFLTTVISFFLAEMGDKTQLATVALGAKYNNIPLVTLGSTAGMLACNALALYFGHGLLKRLPMEKLRKAAAALFALFAVAILLGY